MAEQYHFKKKQKTKLLILALHLYFTLNLLSCNVSFLGLFWLNLVLTSVYDSFYLFFGLIDSILFMFLLTFM